MNQIFSKLGDNWKEVAKKLLRFSIQAFIVGYLAYQLYTIGLAGIIKSLPTQPMFYVLYLIIYFSLPIAEVFIYRIKWDISFKESLPIFIQKKVLNTDVIGYSGEFYLYHWAKTNLGLPSREVLKFVKDNNILSSAASTLITLGLLMFFVTQGYISIWDYIGDIDAGMWVLIGIGAAVVGGLGYKFRKYIISLNLADSTKIFSLHASRILVINILQILQWYVARPDILLSVWFSLSAVQIISSRIPFLPSGDVLFVNVALEMSGLVEVPKEALVGILTANLILKRIMNVSSYLLSSVIQKQTEPILDEEREEFSEKAD